MGGGPEPITLLRAYFSGHGLLLCNENKLLPSLFDVGGDWNAIVALIESREVFYSKVFGGRVTYLSNACYWQLKPYRQRLERLSPQAGELYSFLVAAGPRTTAELKRALALPSKTLSARMDELFSALLVTAIRRDRTMNASWSSFQWGTFAVWEADAEEHAPDPQTLSSLLSPLLTEKQIKKLLR